MYVPKVSVVIPVYNTEAYVREAVESIMNQTFRDLEIIIVNDGSTDGSTSVIKSLEDADKRITVISQENQGLSAARNAGMRIASGKYIYFMDSDDLLDAGAFASCYEKCEREDLDFVLFDADSFCEEEIKCDVQDYRRAVYLEDRVYGGPELLERLLTKNIYRASVCLNFVNRFFLVNNDLTFYGGIVHEDELFTAISYIKAGRVGMIPEPYFKRRMRSGSITTKKYSFVNISGYMTVVKELSRYAKEHAKKTGDEKLIERLICYIINPAIYEAHYLTIGKRLRVFLFCLRGSYLKLIRLKNIIILLFPVVLPVKAFFKSAS
ncbi:MAG: glycosyltransferase [Bacteroidales bacterium]|jgi:glycosyltransferase involved in cell wall biosynthesis|nr:glycosyltransferase [Bacteroidales bacterium]